MKQPMNIERDNKFQYLTTLIGKLSENEEYIVPVFLLKSQYVEYGLKYLLGWYPYKPKNFYPADFLEKATLGQTIGKIRELNDAHLKDIVEEAKEFLVVRNLVTHHLLTSEKSIEEIKKECKAYLKLAEVIEQRILFLIDYVQGLSR